jgi:ABC-type glycerol-3-phosphate transport system substrate-binding protein
MRMLRYIVMAGLLLCGLAIVGFGPRAGDAVPPGCVVVDYWEKWTGYEEAQMREIVNDFNETVGRQKGIFVRYLSTSAVNHKTLVATAAGVPPDIAGLWDGNLVQFAELGALQPLDELAREHGISAERYKPVYWNACVYKGELYALISTPAVVALHYNRVAFEQAGDALRAAGLNPARAPRTTAEVDRYAAVLLRRDDRGRIERAGYLPWEPDWYLPYMYIWFGGEIWDPATRTITLTDPQTVAAYEWIASYSKKLGRESMATFRGGFGNFDSPQNPFLTGTVLMEQQGPWMPNYIDHRRPELQRLHWSREEERTKPPAERRRNYFWAAAPFPSARVEMVDVSLCPFDSLVIPRGAKHKREAFEFIAYVQRQDVMEKLCRLHCKNSPLSVVSDAFMQNHPNPYIDVFERLACSPNARSVPQCPIWPEIADEMTVLAQRLAMAQTVPSIALLEAESRLRAKYELFVAKQRARGIAQ